MSDRLMLDLGYRLRGVFGADMAGNLTGSGGSPPGCCTMMGADFITHNLQAGVSFAPAGLAEPSGDDERWYVSLFGGVSIPETTRMHYSGTQVYDISRDTGYVIGSAIGTQLWSDEWRGEIELAYAKSDVSEVFDRNDVAAYEASGDLAHLTVLANLWRDFALPVANIYPYLGGGLGIALTLPDWCIDWGTISGQCIDDDDGVFDTSEPALAAQAGLGVRLGLSDHFTLDLGYRLRGVFGADMAANNIDTGGSPPGYWSMMGGDFITHNLQAGLTWTFF
jgi:opacity protein-like surface antigen